jgi:hypothetical protein
MSERTRWTTRSRRLLGKFGIALSFNGIDEAVKANGVCHASVTRFIAKIVLKSFAHARVTRVHLGGGLHHDGV